MNNLERVIRTATEEEVRGVVAKKRHIEAERELEYSGRARTKEGLGVLRRVIPAREFYRWAQDHGDVGVWSDKKWLKEWDRDNPQFKVK